MIHPESHTSYPDFGLGDHNYCRNPDSSTKPWCYNSEGTEPRYQFCDVPDCTTLVTGWNTCFKFGVPYIAYKHNLSNR